jgi:lysophospholipase L1-like esterase
MNTTRKTALMASAFLLVSAARFPLLALQEVSPTRFQSEIDAFLEEDKVNPPPRQTILFIGSSIFRGWENLKEQMAPLPVFNRAFGGSRTGDILYYMDKIVLPYEPTIIVYYCGSNDINAGEKAEAISGRFREFVARVHAKLPATRVFFVSVNRAPQKQDRWDIVDEANRQVHAYCLTDKRLGFIDVNPALFDREGNPRLELYQEDRLHFKPQAYAEFTAIIKPIIAQVWDLLKSSKESPTTLGWKLVWVWSMPGGTPDQIDTQAASAKIAYRASGEALAQNQITYPL